MSRKPHAFCYVHNFGQFYVLLLVQLIISLPQLVDNGTQGGRKGRCTLIAHCFTPGYSAVNCVDSGHFVGLASALGTSPELALVRGGRKRPAGVKTLTPLAHVVS